MTFQGKTINNVEMYVLNVMGHLTDNLAVKYFKTKLK